ncbi:TPA: hypothetical protein U1B14_002019 [Streptococcus suis]|uniref:hypothetical protein n=1 Tax=Streptococcus suis TaxID=1307 RepID=UPI00209BAA3F|nr:hypothetical protein [Streptococcus suis]MCO8207912.1 hypothetical protein [Streptococcus suis]MCO8212330.1 hypothetical protein [Streptococcus suis]MCO8212473.1 hypothetical protein [Streptococcus suis]HEM3492593.1 hypothetical protein [Streptococcus suis]HEM3494884.1 hypothetical protein [Streptococcus suis]
MKVNMEYKIDGRKFVLKDEEQGIKQYSSLAKLSFNNTDESSFIVSAEEIKVLPTKNGEINTNILQKIAENHEHISKFIDLFECDGKLRIYSDQESKLNAFIWIAKNWTDEWSTSPFSYSFYSSKNIEWGHKPEGSLRVADHWNFNTCEEREHGILNGQHCRTAEPVDGWAVCKFENGLYHLIEKF